MLVLDLERGSDDGRRYDLVYAGIGGRHFGRNRVPVRARVVSYDQVWRMRFDRLTPDEATLYSDLVSDVLGEAVRLEQERIDWTWAVDRLPYD